MLSLGIRREGKNRWERRVPLSPDAVKEIISTLNCKVYIQPSEKRIFEDYKYEHAGAVLQDDLSKADVIIGVKEVPEEELIPNKTYLYFSHTHKGQSYNMTSLRAILEKKIQLLDYELLTNESNQRLVYFSVFAGYTGTIDILHGLGQRLLVKGFGTPFLNVGMSYQYSSLEEAKLDITKVGKIIKENGLPKTLGPLVFTFTGSDGNVCKGALEIFQCLPHEFVSIDVVKNMIETNNFKSDRVYGVKLMVEDFLYKKDSNSSKDIDRYHYFGNSDEYNSNFAEKFAPFTSVLINGILWNSKSPRLLTNQQTKELADANNLRLISISDISCDPYGSLEFMSKVTTIDEPFFYYNPKTQKNSSDITSEGIQILSVDNLPTELPLESSWHFSSTLLPWIKELLKGNLENTFTLRNARLTTSDGKLVERFHHLYDSLEKFGKTKKVLLLGAGYVAEPLVDYLLRNPNLKITIANRTIEKAKLLASKKNKNVSFASLNLDDKESFSKLVAEHDCVVSFVTANHHPVVAEQCIKHKKNMLTSSYISPAMAALDSKAKEAGITILNELGLDPGIDHLTAMRFFENVPKGGKLISFVSWCGGLPAPENSDNPLGYKFSWSPRGVLLAGLNNALYKWDNQIYKVPGEQLFKTSRKVQINKGLALEGLPNRDSLSYIEKYKLGHIDELKTMFRGTLRYVGYSELMAGFNDLGFFSVKETPSINGMTWPDLLKKILNLTNLENLQKTLYIKLKEINSSINLVQKGFEVSEELALRIYETIKWLKMLETSTIVSISAGTPPSVLDAFCALLQLNMLYEKNEKDAVYMHHEFEVEYAEGKIETHTSTLVAYGEVGGYSAMAKTVGLPAAMGVEMLLNGELNHRKGVIAPMTRQVKNDIYEPLIKKLEEEGIKFVEKQH
ncbi:hypothetical protein HDU92_002229 [Lobulomyces angularis]|nr:hypothetical protein HDU92_002229 [Lobulomyces angularis]